MATYIIRLDDEKADPPVSYYLEWSTVVDAPVTRGMSRGEFEAYYRQENGERGMDELPERMARVDAKGTSSLHDPSVNSVLSGNRAGKGETRLTKDQILDFFCRKGAEGEPPEGASYDVD